MKVLKWILGVVVVLVLVVIVFAYSFLKSTLPDYEGELVAPELKDKVEIIRDSYGMPHIYAQNDEDLYFAFGFCTAQDRLFQMEMIRRASKGRLSEVLGEKLVHFDTLFRTITATKSMEDSYAELSPELKVAIESFVKGINYYQENRKGRLPFEFTLLGYEPEPWKPVDIIGFYYYMSWDQNYPIKSELTHAAISERVGAEMANEIYIDFPPGYSTIIPKGENPIAKFTSKATEKAIAKKALEILKQIETAREITGPVGITASNNWVVSPEKSETGMAIFSNDPHLAVGVPSVWYEAHLVTPTMNVSGSTIPGGASIITGANEHVAWGITNINADDADFYIEKIHPDDPYKYKYMGKWEEMIVKKDVIKVKDGEDVPIEIRITRHGPIIDDVNKIEEAEGFSMSLKWTAPDFPNSIAGFYFANKAKNIDDLEEAAGYHKCSGLNWVYADDQGNIGFWLAMGIPIRNGFKGDVPLPGWDGKHEWNGYVPTEKQPHMRNPAQGWIATANNKTVGDDYPYTIASNFANPDRFTRIAEMLQEKEKLGVEDFKEMQADYLVLLARDWVPILENAISGVELTESESEALSLLTDWDFVANADGVPPAVFHAFVNNLVENTFKARLGDELYDLYVGKNKNIPFNALRYLIDKGQSPWFDDPDTSETEDLNAIFVKSFKEGVQYLEEEMGDNQDKWIWGKLHTLTIYHPFGKKSPLMGALMNIGPFPMGGSIFTVSPTVYHVEKSWEVTDVAGLRHIIDFSDSKNSLRIMAGGVSGNFMSPHYDDQVDKWLKYEYRPFVLDRESVEKDIKYTLIMKPE